MHIKSPLKGRSLERAVRLIQESILRSDPKLDGCRFSIEPNKIISVFGVRHEIDVLVKTLPDSPYESTSIFECKDWQRPVGKNEVMILSGKVKALNANKGFLVARSISRDAAAQIQNEPRLDFIKCADEFLSPFNDLQLMHAVHELLPIKILVKMRCFQASDSPVPMEWRDKGCLMNGKPVSFAAIVKEHLDKLVSQDQDSNQVRYRNPGVHHSEARRFLQFEPGQFSLGDHEIETLEIQVWFFVSVGMKKLTSKFELEGQGAAFSFEPINDLSFGGQLEIYLPHRPAAS